MYKDNKLLLSKYNVITNYAVRRGILILIKKQTGITLGNVYDHDNKDILVISVMTSANETIDIAAIYGPSHEDDPSFFQEVYDTLERRGNKNRIRIGIRRAMKRSKDNNPMTPIFLYFPELWA